MNGRHRVSTVNALHLETLDPPTQPQTSPSTSSIKAFPFPPLEDPRPLQVALILLAFAIDCRQTEHSELFLPNVRPSYRSQPVASQALPP